MALYELCGKVVNKSNIQSKTPYIHVVTPYYVTVLMVLGVSIGRPIEYIYVCVNFVVCFSM
jgi:hypothetical protein